LNISQFPHHMTLLINSELIYILKNLLEYSECLKYTSLQNVDYITV